jgi:uncharacterized protein
MSTSVTIEETRVTFPNQLTSMAGILFNPPDMDKTKEYPALAVAHPFGGVKEQTSGNYARKMAEKGYVTLAFDASHQGESGGYPRDTENPSERLEDIRCAIDYLTTLPIVDVERIGLLGVCAGGSYVLGVAPTEMRAKAVASVSLWDMGMMAREGWPVPYNRAQLLVEIGKQRTAEARGLTIRRTTASLRKELWRTHPRLSRNPMTITELRGPSTIPLAACSSLPISPALWISATTRASKKSRRARSCS